VDEARLEPIVSGGDRGLNLNNYLFLLEFADDLRNDKVSSSDLGSGY